MSHLKCKVRTKKYILAKTFMIFFLLVLLPLLNLFFVNFYMFLPIMEEGIRGHRHFAFAPAIEHAAQPRKRQSASHRAKAVGQAEFHAGKTKLFHEHIGEDREPHRLTWDAGDGADGGGKDNDPAIKEGTCAWSERCPHTP